MSRAQPRHVLMTTDAVGGVWRYSVDLAAALNAAGTRVLLVNIGPRPSESQQHEVAALERTRLIVLDEKLDWMAAGPVEASTAVARERCQCKRMRRSRRRQPPLTARRRRAALKISTVDP